MRSAFTARDEGCAVNFGRKGETSCIELDIN